MESQKSALKQHSSKQDNWLRHLHNNLALQVDDSETVQTDLNKTIETKCCARCT